MKQPSERISRFLFLFIIGVIIVKSFSGSVFFEPKNHKGRGFFVRIPEGWTQVKKKKGEVYPQGTDFVRFVPRGIDPDVVKPEATISIYTKKLTTPIWIEDEFPDIVASLRGSGFDVRDKGEIKVDDKISYWVVYYDRTNNLLNLEFYIVSDNNNFFKMQYSAVPDKFQHYRRSFEELKNSFKFRFSLY
jgi:hypothetical protein